MQIKKVEELYDLIKTEEITDIHAVGYLLRHRKSGARVMLLENEDENKVFHIAFRTPPANSTGVAHILEHSVLCGSRDFPLKDPFVELVKGSLNTFLNAMTYPDKTMYPVASCNDQDFQNLMHVYLDAVFYPNIYEREEIFRQEGWHYHLETPEDPITYNGVVYNEMKGAFSSVEDVLDREIFNALFPDTAYGVESGGDPACIPDLSYEEFLKFHSTYYHPSNSYIYLYGNMDMAEKLLWIDQQYLSKFDKIEVDSEIRLQEPFAERKDLTLEYPILDNTSEENNTYLSYNTVIGTSLDIQRCTAFEILEYALISAPGARLKKALLDAGIGKDITGSYDDGIYQPFFSVIAKNANESDKERFLQVIEDTLRDLAENGIDKKALEAGINYFEFRFREADYASFPKGLIYGIDVFDSWLYDEEQPWSFLKLLDVYEELKKQISTGYFEQLIRTCFLENPHTAVVTVVPKKGLAARKEQEVAEKLAAYKAGLSEQEIQNLVEKTKALKVYQESEETPEALASIPMLTRKDIRKESVRLYNKGYEESGIRMVHHDVETNGITYLTLLFDTEQVPDQLIPYMGVLKSVLGYVDTQHFGYADLFNEINAKSGGISCGLQVFPIVQEMDKGTCRRMFGIKAKCLNQNIGFVFSMIREILSSSSFDDTKRIYEIIAQLKSRAESGMQSAGHSTAVLRASAGFSPSSCFQEKIAGIVFFRLLEELEKHFEEKKEELILAFRKLMGMIFRPENLTISVTGDQDSLKSVREEVKFLKEILHTETVERGKMEFVPVEKKEAFVTPGQVQYVATAGNFRKAGFVYTGALRILKVMLSYDYLWNNIRVKGGAYGCMSGFKRNGDSYLVSYRDPNLKKTLEVYEGTAEYLRRFQADEREMTKYIIGTISELDVPMTPATKGSVSMNAYFSGLTEADFQKERDEILQAEVTDIRKLADLVDAIVKQQQICVVGSEKAVEEQKELFDSREHLIS